ncbi:MAG: hypothetical protein PQJ46_01355 [Spirochaetales bacterium]|nr:hypothetical protein [Spirochaetales bacterium]
MKWLLKVLSIIAAVAYPFVVFLLLWKFNIGTKGLVFVLLGMGFAYFIGNSGDLKNKGLKRIQLFVVLSVSLILAVLTFITENKGFVKLYPLLINFFLLLSFGLTLFTPPPMIYRFALMQNKNLEEDPHIDKVRVYCKRVTIIWCCFFVLNIFISLSTALWASDFVWTLYNGMISYILMGTLFVSEWIIRKIVEKRWKNT